MTSMNAYGVHLTSERSNATCTNKYNEQLLKPASVCTVRTSSHSDHAMHSVNCNFYSLPTVQFLRVYTTWTMSVRWITGTFLAMIINIQYGSNGSSSMALSPKPTDSHQENIAIATGDILYGHAIKFTTCVCAACHACHTSIAQCRQCTIGIFVLVCAENKQREL